MFIRFTESDDEYVPAMMVSSTLSMDGEHRPVPVEQLASKDCLVCGRAYRYSHNARRHERTAHCYDRYTNKIEAQPPNLNSRPATFKQNNYYDNNKESILKANTIKNRVEFQKRPEILKSLLTAQNDEGMSDSEAQAQLGYDSPETMISEPDLPSGQVEAIVSAPDTYSDSELSDDENDYVKTGYRSDDEEMESDVDVGDCSQLDINKIIGIEDDVITDIVYDQVYEESNENVEVENIAENQYNNNEEYAESNVKQEDYEEEDIVAPLVPIVEMNDGLPEDNADSGESDLDMSPENRLTIVENDQNFTITSSQRAFLINYRDLIEQINTMKCKCCDRSFPRRKAVIQHLQKNGSKIPKHTCYTCVIPFAHIGALLSHMRYNCCNDTWKLIYREDGIPDSMVVDDAPSSDAQDYGDDSVKAQFRDILNSRSYCCKICSAKFHLKQYVMKHIFDAHENTVPQVPLTCFYCKSTFADNRIWKKHVRKGECTVDICCELCSDKFFTVQDFNEHAITAHADAFQQVLQSSESVSRNIDARNTNCPICKKSLSNYHNLVKHLKMVHNQDKPHICQYCHSKFQHVTELQQHINIEHSERMNGDDFDVDDEKEEVTGYTYSCTDCSAVFDSVEGWTEHQISVHHHIAHACDLCNKKFWDVAELEEHKVNHSRGKPFKCMLCSHTYSSSKNLSEHINQVHSESINDRSYDSQFYCDICVRSFKSRQAFSNHMRIHAKVPTTNRRPGDIKRSIEMQYRSQPQIPRQAPPLPPMKPITQINQAPYSCDICGKGFLHKKNIWKHKKMLHPDIVSQSKENIGNAKSKSASTEEEDLNEDQNTHLSTPQFDSFGSTPFDQPDNSGSELPYQCDLCDKKFAIKSSIWKHKRVKHGAISNPHQESIPKPVTPKLEDTRSDSRANCTICNINFTDKKAYYRHRKNVHKVKICKICGVSASTSTELFEHLQTAHVTELLGFNASRAKTFSTDDEDPEENNRVGNHKGPRYSCEVCGKGFNELVAIQNHVCFQRRAVSETYDCEICNKSYTSISALKSHRGWHLRSPDGRAAFSNSGLWMPQNKVTNKVSKHEVLDAPKPKAEPVSPVQIKRKLPPDVQVTVLKKAKHTNEVILETVSTIPVMDSPEQQRQLAIAEDRYCHACNKPFTKKAAFQRHMAEIHKQTTVYCPICKASFTRKASLLIHMRKHDNGDISDPPDPEDTDEDSNDRLQSFACDICNISYDSVQSLKVHKLKQHPAGQGGVMRQFYQPPPRNITPGRDGRVMEEGVIKEFKCSLCEEEWDTEPEMWNHHHFRCTLCGMYFSQHQYLVTHTQTLHTNKEHLFLPCNKCNRSFMNKQSLQRHIANVH